MKLLLDTCTILWAVLSPKRLSSAAQELLTKAESQIFFSPLSCAEIACGCERGRIQLDRHWKLWFRHFTTLNAWNIIPLGLPIVEEAYSLPPPFHADPVDRVLVATSRLHQCMLLTADSKILQYPHVTSVW